MKKTGRGGRRKNAGRKPTGNVRMLFTVRPVTAEKINRLRKSDQLWRRAGQVLDDIMQGVSVHGAEYLNLALATG